MIRGTYLFENIPSPPNNLFFESLEEKGCTDIFTACGNFITKTNTTINYINTLLDSMKNTDLKLHFCRASGDYLWSGWTETFSNKLEEVINECPDITGFSLDDFALWPTRVIDENDPTQREAQYDFSNTITDTIHDINPDILVSAAIPANYDYTSTDYKFSSIENLSQIFDFLIPELYRDSYYIYRPNNRNWFINSLKKSKSLTSKDNIITGISTVDNLINPRPVLDILNDINNSLILNKKGYVLWVWDNMDSNFIFRKERFRNYVTRKYVPRIYI